MPKFSVKKPYTILVMVVAIIILGFVSLSSMTTDLLPSMSLPYLLVITTYPGASPEKVESTVCEPMESALGTIKGVKNVYSTASENYGMVQLEFVDGTDMDSAMVKVSSALDTVRAGLPDECGTPSIMEISMDMMASVYLAVSCDGKDIQETSRFVEDTVKPYLERQDGVTSISSLGTVENTLVVELSQEKVDALNDKILAKANEAFAEALEQLEDAKQQLEDAQKELDKGKKELEDGQKELNSGKSELQDGKDKLESGKKELEDKQNQTNSMLATQKAALNTAKSNLESIQTKLATAKALDDAMKQIDQTTDELMSLQGCYNSFQESSRKYTDAQAVIDSYAGVVLPPETEEPQELAEARLQLAEAQTELNTLKTNLTGNAVLEQTWAEVIQMDENQPTMEQLRQMDWADPANFPALEAAMPVMEAAILTGAGTLTAQKVVLTEQMLFATGGALDYETFKNQVDQILAAQNITDLNKAIQDINNGLIMIEQGQMTAAIEFANGKAQISLGEYQMEVAQAQLDSAQAQIDSGKESLKDAEEQLKTGWEEYEKGLEQYEKQREEALRSANADQLLDISTLAQIVYAQNFSMPAGYLDDKQDASWLLKIGDSYSSVDEISNLLLADMDEIGAVRLGDVADITVIDNADDSYARLNGNPGIILSVFKSSTTGTNEVSKNVEKASSYLEQEYEGLSIVKLMDQGDYITLIIKGVVQSMVVGAALAIVVLALFLKDVKPTIVVAVSIPLSVLTALILMYFSGISLNMMSLSGLALGIGMLVDNSIVVIENIYRLRSKGVEAPRASVQGTRQVAGAIIASTLTTVSVFAPMVFSTGTVRELLMPISLTIIFTLTASLLVAMTVVPATGSTILRNSKEKKHPLFDKIQNVYGKMLAFCLRFKIVPLSIAIGLLAFSVWAVLRMGLVMIPEMTSNQIQVSITMPEDIDKEESFRIADQAVDAILTVDGVESVGAMNGATVSLVASASGSGSSDFHTYSLMIITENEDAGEDEIKRICKDIEEKTADLNCELTIATGMEEMSTFLGSGLSIRVYGDDLDKLKEITEDICEIVDSVEGYTEISNGQDEPDQVVHLVLDRDAAMKQGLTVAQIFAEMNKELTRSATATQVTLDGVNMKIIVKDRRDPLLKENILDYTFPIKETDEDGFTRTVDHPLSEFATVRVEDGVQAISRENQSRYMTVTASVEEGYNATLLNRELEPLIAAYELPSGYSFSSAGGESDAVNEMIFQMLRVILMGLAFIYLVMVAQFQSLLSPFIVLFTVPLAFTGGLIGLLVMGEPLSVMGMMGFVVLLGTVVNNGIVFVDYANQLRIGGLDREDALIATGKTRMRPILMTALTTILAMASLLFGDDMASQMSRGMAIVVAGGLAYATLMTLFIIPVVYDILFKRKPINVDIGSEDLDDVPDDAADYLRIKKEEALAAFHLDEEKSDETPEQV